MSGSVMAFGELSRFLETVRDWTLSNGVRALYRQRSGSSLATFQMWYKVGSRDEPVGRTGLSHLVEHMMFKDTDRTGPEEFSRIIQAQGGQANAFTTKDFTAYYVVMASDRIPLAMDLERDRMRGLKLREDHFLSEKKVVMEERRLRTETQPEAVLVEELEAVAFCSHPYRWPIIGWMEDIEGISLADVRSHWRAHYAAGNLLVVGISDVEPDSWLELLESRFGDLPVRKPRGHREIVEPPQRAERRVLVRRQAQVGVLALAYHVPRISHRDAPALEVLACLLGSGRSSRLYRRLVRQEGLALGVEVEYPLLSLSPGLFKILVRILPGGSLERAEGAVQEELERLCGPDPQLEGDLQRAKEHLERAFVLSLDSLMAQALLMAQYELCAGLKCLGEYLPGIRAVTPEAVREAVRRYLCGENRSTGWLVPSKRG